MDRDTNYVVVGAFVLLVIGMAVSFVFWYTNEQDRRTYQRYEIYFQGTVSGLTAGSPVRYLGVNVGKVVRTVLDPRQRNRVEVIVEIESAAPIDGSTLASLNLQGITGLLFIDLEQDPKATAPATLAQGYLYPVIRSAPSDFNVLLSSLPLLAARAGELLDHLNQGFSEENVRTFKATLDNARLASERLPALARDAQQLVADMRRASLEVEGAADDLRAVTQDVAPDLKLALANVSRITQSLASTSDHLDRFVADNGPRLSRFTSQSLPELEQLLRDAHEATTDFRDLSRSLKQNPSQLLYESNYHGVELPK
jgi:phospholipid/cholesterol/gamma-HCH transport system substrate-binding protein